MGQTQGSSTLYVFAFCVLALSTLRLAEIDIHHSRVRWGRSRSQQHHKSPPLSHIHVHSNKKRAVNGYACIEAAPTNIKAPKKNPWRQLDGNETKAVTRWLYRQKDLNFKHGCGGTANTLYPSIELMIPNRTDVLVYIDGNGPEPARYGKATIDFYSDGQHTLRDVIVGPLPVSNATTWRTLGWPYTKKDAGIRNIYNDFEMTYGYMSKLEASVKNITKNLWPGAKYIYWTSMCVLQLIEII